MSLIAAVEERGFNGLQGCQAFLPNYKISNWPFPFKKKIRAPKQNNGNNNNNNNNNSNNNNTKNKKLSENTFILSNFNAIFWWKIYVKRNSPLNLLKVDPHFSCQIQVDPVASSKAVAEVSRLGNL